ncbi:MULTISPECIES: disulfide bond formation protein B [Legionella]|uniref:Disulfide bond formation protein B n=1 Tax=Legionella steelei TaxID=947033 RepID=A0A0W0ZH80_9GAMM|nr:MULTISPECIES: disulfide bond formation protein B [Legionella]KTD68543.1 disulfide bond formation protein DsbB [Legionella steelei]MBN9227657.1 disulfide bond formation protein B [Legionella steelei]OJW05975.1 MAG: disulfide bond formation protein DsbB [Legionella sp. 39-23]
MTKVTFKKMQTFNAILTVLVLFASFYFQYIDGLVPCPLCIMQRVCVLLLLAVMGLSFRTLKKARLISFLQILIACAGLYFSLRQLWLQSLPAGQAPACMPSLDILMRYLPWQTVVKALFLGTGDCAEANWHLFGISMPGWSAMYFLFMALMGCLLFWQTRLSKLREDNF